MWFSFGFDLKYFILIHLLTKWFLWKTSLRVTFRLSEVEVYFNKYSSVLPLTPKGEHSNNHCVLKVSFRRFRGNWLFEVDSRLLLQIPFSIRTADEYKAPLIKIYKFLPRYKLNLDMKNEIMSHLSFIPKSLKGDFSLQIINERCKKRLPPLGGWGYATINYFHYSHW